MTDSTLYFASWNMTQSIQTAFTALNNLKPFVPEEYTIEDNVDKLERKLYQAYKFALKIISDIETANGNKNENN